VVELGLTDLEALVDLDGDQTATAGDRTTRAVSGAQLVPFARRQDNDDVSVLGDLDQENVTVIHDFASPAGNSAGLSSTSTHGCGSGSRI